jgi:tetratricopeptide (TPR) repeat protein
MKQEEFYQKGKEAFHQGEYKKAIEIFEEYLELHPRDEETYFLIGNSFHMLGDVSKAIKAYQKVLEINPEHTDSSVCLSILYNDIGRYDEGRKIFDQAQKRIKTMGPSLFEDSHINKKFSLKHYELGGLYYSYHRFEEAMLEFQKSLNLDPQNLECRVKYAKAMARKGSVMKAVEELKSLKAEYPNYYPGRISLGLLYYSLGKVIEAQWEWNYILKKDPQHGEANMYLKMASSATETLIDY